MTAADVRALVEAAPRFELPLRDQGPPPRELLHVFADELPEGDTQFDDELVEGLLGRNSLGVLYGDSNSGKTFLAVELAGSVARGADFLGRRTEHAAVLYLATEAAGSVALRLQAYQRHHGVRLPHVVVVQSPISLFDGAADVAAVLALAEQVQARVGVKVGLVIGDTLARMSAGANENSGEDMGVVMRNADSIRAGTGATFLWIHHVGKDAARGMRGWSGMRAAIDTEIEVVADEATGVRTAEVTKQRDLPGKGERLGFRLVPLVMGHNQWGTPRTSCVVEPTDAPPPKLQRSRRQSEVAGAITELLNSNAPAGMKKAAIVRHFAERYERATIYRELKKMLEAERLHEVCGVYALRQAYQTEGAR